MKLEKTSKRGPKDIFCPGLDGIKGSKPVYNIHYNIMKKLIKDTITEGPLIPDIKLCYMDCNSIIHLMCINPCEFIKKHPEYFDTSYYPKIIHAIQIYLRKLSENLNMN